MVSGYNNLHVGNMANHVVAGLTPGPTYYYRVRGTNTSTQSNTITVATKAASTAANHFDTNCNQVTPENSGKWGSVEGCSLTQSGLRHSSCQWKRNVECYDIQHYMKAVAG